MSPPRTAGRPTKERSAAIGRDILEAACATFLEHGYDHATMDLVAAAARVSKGTLYARYPTKGALLGAVLKRYVQRWTFAVRRGPAPSLEFKARLQDRARRILLVLTAEESRPYVRLATQAAFDGGELRRILLEQVYLPVLDDLTEEIVRGARDFPMPPAHPQRVARMILAMLYGWGMGRQLAGEATQAAATTYADGMIDVLFMGRAAW